MGKGLLHLYILGTLLVSGTVHAVEWTDAQWRQALATLEAGGTIETRKLLEELYGVTKLSPLFLKAVPKLLKSENNLVRRRTLSVLERFPAHVLEQAPALLREDDERTLVDTLEMLADLRKPDVPSDSLLRQVLAVSTRPGVASRIPFLAQPVLAAAPLSDDLWRDVAALAGDRREEVRALVGGLFGAQDSIPADLRPLAVRLFSDPSKKVRDAVRPSLRSLHPFPPELWKGMPDLVNHPETTVRESILTQLYQEPEWEKKLSAAGGEVYSLAKYTEDCERDGMEIPESFDCRQGEEIPVYKTVCGEEGERRTIRITPENYRSFEDPIRKGVTCDNPAHLLTRQPAEPCTPGSRIQVTKAKKNGSFCVSVCRKYRPGPADEFQDINMICHNPENGKTCFFNTPVGNTIDGKRMLKPGSSRDRAWGGMGNYDTLFRCMDCHDNDPIIVTPHLKNIVSLSPENTGRKPFGPYFMSGRKYPVAGAEWKDRYFLTDPGVKSCTECHRLGNGATCGWLGEQLSAKAPPGVDSQACAPDTFPAMPPGAHEFPPEEKAELAKTMKRLKECCEAGPKSALCRWEKQRQPTADAVALPASLSH